MIRNRKSAIQNLKWVGIFAIAFAFAFGGVEARAQQPKKIPRIGFMIGTSPSIIPDRIEGFRQGLRELGYVEGKNIVIEYRVADGKVERLPDLLAELVRLKVEVIVTGGIVNRAAKAATTSIPIVIAFDHDPVANGLVISLARPGGNITGLSALYPELSGKQLELLKETVPRLSRVAVFGTSNQPGNAQLVRQVERTAESAGVQLRYFDILSPTAIVAAFRGATAGRADAVL